MTISTLAIFFCSADRSQQPLICGNILTLEYPNFSFGLIFVLFQVSFLTFYYLSDYKFKAIDDFLSMLPILFFKKKKEKKERGKTNVYKRKLLSVEREEIFLPSYYLFLFFSDQHFQVI